MGEVLPNSDRVGQCNKLVMANALPEGPEPATNRQSKRKVFLSSRPSLHHLWGCGRSLAEGELKLPTALPQQERLGGWDSEARARKRNSHKTESRCHGY